MPDTSRNFNLPRILGVDVAKATLTFYDSASRRSWSCPNRTGDIAAAFERAGPVDLIVCEATGGYERACLEAALDGGRRIHRADAAKVKAFIRSHGGRAKTDPIDASWLARYGADRFASLAAWSAAEPAREALAALVRRRQDLVSRRTAAKNRAGAPKARPAEDVVSDLIIAEIDFLTHQLDQIDRRIKDLVRANDKLNEDMRLLRAIPGLGFVAAATLLAILPELGQLSRREIASLAGLAPHPRDSGEMNGRRWTGGGRAALRPILFMAALTAARCHPKLSAFYANLRDNGKDGRRALTAVARKLVVIANAVLRDKTQPQLT